MEMWVYAGMLAVDPIQESSGFAVRPSHAPVSDHIDGSQAQGCSDLDDCLPHSTVGCILNDGIPCEAGRDPCEAIELSNRNLGAEEHSG